MVYIIIGIHNTLINLEQDDIKIIARIHVTCKRWIVIFDTKNCYKIQNESYPKKYWKFLYMDQSRATMISEVTMTRSIVVNGESLLFGVAFFGWELGSFKEYSTVVKSNTTSYHWTFYIHRSPFCVIIMHKLQPFQNGPVFFWPTRYFVQIIVLTLGFNQVESFGNKVVSLSIEILSHWKVCIVSSSLVIAHEQSCRSIFTALHLCRAILAMSKMSVGSSVSQTRELW